VKSSVMKYNEV